MGNRDLTLAMTLHNPPEHPHWSESVEWRHDRWDPMCNAPRAGYPILHVRGRDNNGKVLDLMHYACGDGDGMMPSFNGWFVRWQSAPGYYGVEPIEWQPMRASYETPNV